MDNERKLSLVEICGIMGTLGRTTDNTYMSEEYEIDGVKYSCAKVNNTFMIDSSDDKRMGINVNYYSINSKDYQNRDVIITHHEASIQYFFQEGDSIILTNDMGLFGGYESFENVERHTLRDGLRKTYYDKDGNSVCTFDLGLNEIWLDGNKKVEFTKEGIKFGNKVLSLDAEKLLLMSGEKVPAKEVVDSFDIEKEKEKIINFANNSDVHVFTKDELESAANRLSRKERYAKEISSYYNEDIKLIRKAIAVRNRLQEAFDNELIPEEVMRKISNNFHKDAMGKSKQL